MTVNRTIFRLALQSLAVILCCCISISCSPNSAAEIRASTTAKSSSLNQPIDRKSVKKFLSKTKYPSDVQKLLLQLTKKKPKQQRWIGQTKTYITALVALPLNARDQKLIISPLREVARKKAKSALYLGRAIQDQFKSDDLTNLAALHDALTKASPSITTTGKAHHILSQTGVTKDWILAVAIVPTKSIHAYIKTPEISQIVHNHYRDSLHGSARKSMQANEWRQALSILEHLHRRKLVSPELYLDVSTCFQQLDSKEDAYKLLEEAFYTFSAKANSDYLERLADQASLLKTTQAETLAFRARTLASQKVEHEE